LLLLRLQITREAGSISFNYFFPRHDDFKVELIRGRVFVCENEESFSVENQD
jgi:hypothetical protein